MVLWAWNENHRVASQYDEESARQLTLIIDEPEVHLHPKWQSKILVSLLNMFIDLAGGNSVQVIASTHSPMVLGSLEGVFKASKDAWYDIDIEADSKKILVAKRNFESLGRYSHWLEGEDFNMISEMTQNAKEVYKEALTFIEGGQHDIDTAKVINNKVASAFSEEDVFYVRWKVFYSKIIL